jgi:hypothetical protein
VEERERWRSNLMRSYMLLKDEKEETEDGKKIKIKWSEHVLLWLEGWSLRFRQITFNQLRAFQ